MDLVWITVNVEAGRDRFAYNNGESVIKIAIPENLIPSMNLGEIVNAQVTAALLDLAEKEAVKEGE